MPKKTLPQKTLPRPPDRVRCGSCLSCGGSVWCIADAGLFEYVCEDCNDHLVMDWFDCCAIDDSSKIIIHSSNDSAEVQLNCSYSLCSYSVGWLGKDELDETSKLMRKTTPSNKTRRRQP